MILDLRRLYDASNSSSYLELISGISYGLSALFILPNFQPIVGTKYDLVVRLRHQRNPSCLPSNAGT